MSENRCRVCDTSIAHLRADALTCSGRCAKAFQRQKRKEKAANEVSEIVRTMSDKTVLAAVLDGDAEEQLKQMQIIIAAAIDGARERATPVKDLPALTRRLQELTEALEARQEKQDDKGVTHVSPQPLLKPVELKAV